MSRKNSPQHLPLRLLEICLCLLLAASCSVLLTLSACSRRAESGLNPGDLAPDFQVQDLAGNGVKLSDFRGQGVLLNFWASWCVPCEAEMPVFEKLYQQLKSDGFTIVAVAVDDTLDRIKDFQTRYNLSFPILFDAEATTRRPYKYTGFPESFLLDKDGRLVMFQDPEDNHPVVRIVGPRDWEAQDVMRRLRLALALNQDR